MRSPISNFLILATLLPGAALSATTNHLLRADPGPHGQFVSVCYSADVGGPANPCLRFGKEGGRVDLAAGVVRGRAEDGTEIAVPLADVTKIRVRFDRGGRVHEYDLLADALRGEPDWAPRGRIRKAVLTSGVTIDFSEVAPGIDHEERVLFWSCEGKAASRIPFDDLVFVQIRSNSFVNDFNDMASYGVLSEAELTSGEVLDLNGREATIDNAGGAIRHGTESVSLIGVRRLAVRDCRRQSSEVVPVVPVVPAAAQDDVLGFSELDLCGERVQLRQAERSWRWIEGSVISQDSLGLQILVDADTLAIPLSGIRKLKIGRGTKSNAGKGALIGGALVGAAGLGAGLSVMGDGYLDVSSDEVVGLAFVGALVGAVIGAAIGSASSSENWEDVKWAKVSVISMPDRRQGLAVSLKF